MRACSNEGLDDLADAGEPLNAGQRLRGQSVVQREPPENVENHGWQLEGKQQHQRCHGDAQALSKELTAGFLDLLDDHHVVVVVFWVVELLLLPLDCSRNFCA